jgi:hypothetical protein
LYDSFSYNARLYGLISDNTRAANGRLKEFDTLKSESRVQPARPFIQTRYGDDCEAIAAQVLPDVPVQEAVQQLQSWNLFPILRPGGASITPPDIVFSEPPCVEA